MIWPLLIPFYNMRSQRYPGMLGDYRAFSLEKKKERKGLVAERFEIALALGDDHVRCCKAFSERIAAVIQKSSRCIGSIINHGHNLIKAGGNRVCHGGVIEDWPAAYDRCHPRGA